MNATRTGFALSLLAVCGILTISFSLSWGLSSPYHPVSHYINEHATYIAAAGIGLLCSLSAHVSSQKRIEALESAVKQLKDM